MVAANYPGTKVAVTEYNFGALNSLNGALTQADVLGIFGREGADLATLWAPPSSTDPGTYAFRMYRDYDGNGGQFGDISVSSTSTDQGRLAVYGARRSGDGALTLMVVNKTGTDLTAPVTVTGTMPGRTAQVYRYSGADLTSIAHAPDATFDNTGTLSATFPANSITELVVADTVAPGPPGTPTASRPSPTGVTLSWPAASDNVGVTGYDVWQRRDDTVVKVGTTASTRLAVTGLTPGRRYTFWVRARDAAGNTGKPSRPVGVTTPRS
jgi:hypothetical protein